jgi:hypothetical protein
VETEALRLAIEEVSPRRAKIETARRQAKEEAHRLKEEARLLYEVKTHGPKEREGHRIARLKGYRKVIEKEQRRSGQTPMPAGDSQGVAVPAVIAAGLNSADENERAAALADLARLGDGGAFSLITKYFDDESAYVRNAAARALYELEPSRSPESFSRALEGKSPELRRKIGAAMAASGLAIDAINNLTGENREKSYNALCLLFMMAGTNEIQPLITAIEEQESVQVRRAAIKLLTLSGHSEIAAAAAKRRLLGQRTTPESRAE